MAKKAPGVKVNRQLETALVEEVRLIREKDDDGKFKHSMVDRMRVYDRALKLQAILLKADSSDWGSEFEKEGE